MSRQKTKQADDVDDDTFEYDGGGFSQCISGFGRNAIEAIGDDLDRHMPGGEEHAEARERLAWHINELVRWCRHFNGKSQRLEQQRDALLAACKALCRRMESNELVNRPDDPCNEYDQPSYDAALAAIRKAEGATR